MTTTATRIQRHLKAPPAHVYRALLDPQAVASWMTPDDMTSEVHEFNAQVGGAFRISLTYNEPISTGKTTAHTDTYHGHFVQLVPNAQVVEVMEFETDDPTMQGEMRLTFTLTAVEGGTDILAIHNHLPPGLSLADNELGWAMAIDKLAAWLATN